MSTWLYSRTNQLILDGLCFCFAFIGAYLIRFEAWPTGADLSQMLIWLPVVVGLKLLVHATFGVYRQIWKFVSVTDAIEIAKCLAIVSTVLLVLRLLPVQVSSVSWFRLPLSVIALDGLGSLSATLAVRALRRILYLHQRRAGAVAGPPAKRIFLYGAGRAGITLYRELQTNRAYEVVGFVDDDPLKIGSQISGVPIVGNGDNLSALAPKYHVDEIIVSMATGSRATLARALSKCRRAAVSAKIIPSLQELLTGKVQISQLRDTPAEEVLGRDSVEVPEFEQVAGLTYSGKRVLVTGAGGSIGSELVRQLLRLSPSSIAMLDKDENAIYELEQELRSKNVHISVEPHIADIRDSRRLRAVFADFMPEIVLHAAAHKHVPLMELHPCEAVLNNIGGTQNLLSLASEFAIERFVFISSDKAVNAMSVMGATKRVGELLVQASANTRGTRFACVRFGNVLGSRGSVVPLFKKQVLHGGPVTITHPEMVRYFMTIQEAVQLILCAGTLANHGEIYVLDMGNPRRILDLAHEIILLAGLEPGRDIQTVVTGLRPGEKLAEELVASSEELSQTPLEKLSLIQPQLESPRLLLDQVSVLLRHAAENDKARVHHLLFNLQQVPVPLDFPLPQPRAMTASA
jgi:FlaA1/EpsC-like NDP-sugar epimerase